MMSRKLRFVAGVAAAVAAGAVGAKAIDRGGRSIAAAAGQLQPGDYVWAPELSATGPSLFVVNLATQRAILFRNGVPIAATTISSGRPGNETPTGVFTILQKRREHYSNLYNNAPMPNMQRLTWTGIALHAGKLPGRPDSHGCIRLPMEFSSLLFQATQLGMTVVITSIPAVPRDSKAPDLVSANMAKAGHPLASSRYEWHPQRSKSGMVSVIVSVADERAVVLRGGVEIGSAPVRVDGPVDGAMAYALRASDKNGRHWLKLKFSGSGEGTDVSPDEGRRFDAPAGFRSAVAPLLTPGSVIIVTPESLKAGSPGSRLTVLDNDVG